MLTWKINDAKREVDVRAADSVVDVLRRAGLTGTKRVCGVGACGACTVVLDGEAVPSCLVPADAVETRAVRTVEGAASEGNVLHPVQRAIIAADGVQCGYCTPGFVMTGIAFYQQWRAEHGVSEPTVETVRAALAGNLCRCGCHLRLVGAIQKACAGVEEVPNAVRDEATAKVTGAATYTADREVPGALEAVLVTSPYPHARLEARDDVAALREPGVRGVHWFVEPGRVVRYVGQEIAAVAADTPEQARNGARSLELRWATLPAALVGAQNPRAPRVYGRDRRSAPSAGEVPNPFARFRWEGNVRAPARSRTSREYRRALAGPGPELEGTYTTTSQSHAPFEPHSCVASWTPDGYLEVYLSTQGVSVAATLVAMRWRIRPSRVRVIAEHVGGAFGCKQDLPAEAVGAVELARVTGRPVRLVATPEQELTRGGHRPGCTVRTGLKLTPDGNLAALRVEAHAETGVAVGSDVAAVAGLLYPGAPRELRDYSVVSHTAGGKPFRAPSGPPAFWALEQTVDDAAHQLGVDPLDLRERWDADPARAELYRWVRRATPWEYPERRISGAGRARRALGLAVGTWHYYLQPRTRVRLRVDGGGALIVEVAVAEIGTGARTLVTDVVAEAFDCAPGDVTVRIGDSRLTGGPMAAGSSLTASLVPSVADAIQRLRDAVVRRCSRALLLHNVEATTTGLAHARGLLPWRDALQGAGPLTVVGRRPRDQGPRPSPWYSPFFGAGQGNPSVVQVSEVEVDPDLGRVRLLHLWCGLSVGRVVSPVMATTQVHGAVIQALGHTLSEERRVDPVTGRTVTASLDDYAIPGVADVPDIDVAFVGDAFGHVPQLAVGLAEVAGLATAPSVGNAVRAATGRRYRDLPLDPRVILEGTQ